MPIFLRRLAKKLTRRQAAFLLVLAGTVLVIGAALYAWTQHVSFGTGVYWAFTTASTVGYGDVTPHNAVGRIVAVGVMVTAIPLLAGVFGILTAAATSSHIRRLLGMDRSLPDEPYSIVFGGHTLVPLMLKELAKRQVPLVLVHDPATGEAQAPEGVRVVEGDPAAESVIASTRPASAREALIATPDDGDALIIAVILRKLAPDLPVIAVVSSPDVAEALHDLGVTQTISVNELVGHAVAKSLESPHASDLLLRMLGTDRYRLAEIDLEPRFHGQPLAEVRRQADGLVLGAVVGGAVVIGVGEDPVLTPTDRLLILVT